MDPQHDEEGAALREGLRAVKDIQVIDHQIEATIANLNLIDGTLLDMDHIVVVAGTDLFWYILNWIKSDREGAKT